MNLEGRVFKDGKFWMAEIPALDYLTQGEIKDAFAMAIDIVETGVNLPGFKIQLTEENDNTFVMSGSDTNALIALMLERQRQKKGLTVREVAARMKSSSPNSVGVYEQGKSTPSLEKLDELLHAINPGSSIVLRIV